jgi:SAM-dependent methyltransferase
MSAAAPPYERGEATVDRARGPVLACRRVPEVTGEGETERGGGYLTDVAYVHNFVDELSPGRLRLVAALNGFPSPPGGAFAYAELGCGHGDTLVTLAAAHPGASFLGVDLNPEHLAFARDLASRGGLQNIRLLERDFADLAHEDLPDLDFITAHGVMSWVGPEARRALADFAGARLKPGGLLYVSYNALPGWAPLEPLRRLMLDSAAGVPGDSLEGARRGLAAARLLSDAGAVYFTSNPAARDMLATMTRLGLPYVVHEYLHAHWEPLYFADVAREMAARGLYFIGELPLYQNYRDLAIPPSLAEIFKGLDDRIVFESLKDFAVNESFRGDVYIKGVAPCTGAATADYFERTPFGPPVDTGRILREVRLPHYTLSFKGALFDALVPALTEAPAPASALARRPALSGFGVPKIRDALLRLALGDQVSALRETPRPRAAPAAGRYRLPLAYNRMIVEQRLSSKDPMVLASPIAGTGIEVQTLQAVAIRMLTGVEPAGRPAWIRAFVERSPIKLHDGDRLITGVEEQQRVISKEVERFCAERLPALVQLGIVEPL